MWIAEKSSAKKSYACYAPLSTTIHKEKEAKRKKNGGRGPSHLGLILGLENTVSRPLGSFKSASDAGMSDGLLQMSTLLRSRKN